MGGDSWVKGNESMTKTREKLLEAKYFFECMIDKQSEHDAFKYNLSAFLAAARSVTFIMQKEFDKVLGFKEWYADKQAKMQGDRTMKLLNNKRMMTIHQQPVRPHANVNVSVTLNIPVPSIGYSVEVIGADGAVIERRDSKPEPPPAPAKTEKRTEWQWYFDELSGKDVVTVCKGHIGKLEALVGECESRFISKKDENA
jgi:hypothetical protein